MSLECIDGKQLLPPYLTSRDAIVPVVEKQPPHVQYQVHKFLGELEIRYRWLATPRQLCEALIRATGKWVD